MRIRILSKVCLSLIGLIIIVGLFQSNRIRNDVHKQLFGLNQLQFHLFKEKLKSRAFSKIDKRFVFNSKEEFLPEPRPSITGGFYDHPLTISFFNDEKEIEIFYTLDGSIPTKQSIQYQYPIYIDKTTVLCLRNFKSDYLPSATVTHTYFINENFRLPILSLVTDPVNLWNKYSGIYANPWKRGKKWERNAHIEYFDVKTGTFLRSSAEIRINGGASRGNRKKSFRVRYPLSSLQGLDDNHILAGGKKEIERTIILRNTTEFRLRDVLFYTIISRVGCFTSRYSPVILFLNGKIWGIYNIRDRIDEQYLRKNFGSGEYRLIRNLVPWEPESKPFREVLDWFESNDLSQEQKFKDAADLIDIDNMTDYWLFNIYAGNVDWPHANIAAFKRLDPQDCKWRYLSRDVDDGFGYIVKYDHDTLEWATRSELRDDLLNGMYNDHKSFLKSTLIVRRFLANESYRWKFINRFCDILNFYLLPEKIEANLDKIIEISAHDIAKDFERWQLSEGEYLEDIQDIRNFIQNRSKYLFSFLQEKFHLDALLTVELFLQPGEGGQIQINTIKPENYPWKAQYFENAPITLTAVPSKNYRFVRWTETSLGKSSTVEFRLNRNLKVAAIFEPIIQK